MDMKEAVFLLRLEQSVKSQATMPIQMMKHIICNADDHLDEISSSFKEINQVIMQLHCHPLDTLLSSRRI